MEELCPKCGGLVSETLLCCMPPIIRKYCTACDTMWIKKPAVERIERVYFNPEGWEEQ